MIEGGGIGDGAIDGVANLYVIDDDTRMPIAGAAVQVGEVSGETDADGLFIARGVHGPQTVAAKASGYRSELWIGADGVNLTMNLQRPTKAAAASGTITGSVDLSSITVAAGHAKAAFVTYLQTDDIGDPENEIDSADMNVCALPPAGTTCDFTLASRVGDLAILALLVDVDLKGTPADSTDDSYAIVGYAYKGGLTVAANATVANLALAPIAAADVVSETVDFGSPPSGLANVAGIVGVETAQGVFQIPIFTYAAMTTVKVPKLSAVGGTGYRLTAIAQNEAMPPTQAIVLRRGQTAATLNAGAWMTPPTGVALTRTHAMFTPTPSATVHSVEYTMGTTNVTSVLNVTVLDGSDAFDLPELVALPGGTIDGKVSAIGAPGLDVHNFALDRDRDKLATVGATPAQVPN